MNLTPSHLASSCSRQQCKLPEAVLAFTLMDYDVITKNDFGGEAFMSLSTVPGGSKSQNMSSRFPRKIDFERKCCCRRCGARFLVGGKLPRVETSSLAAYVPEEERWVSVSLTVWFLASFRSGLGTQARCQVPRLTWKWVGETDLVPQALGNNFKQPLESKTRALAQNCCIMCSLHVIHQLVVADHPEDSFSFLFYLFSLSLTSLLLQTTLFWGLFFSFSFLFYLLSHQLVVADHPVLRTLEVRTSDKAAQDFVRRQRARMVE